MKGTQIGEFEEVVLLVVGLLYPEAYGISIRKELETQVGRKVVLGAIHSALNRLESKGFLKSSLAEETHVRGGRRKRLFQITAVGKNVLETNRALRNELWNKIPDVAWDNLNYGGI